MTYFVEDLALPDFLDRKKNGIVHEPVKGLKRADRNGIVWPKKRNWRKLEARRRKREKAEGVNLSTFRAQKGQ